MSTIRKGQLEDIRKPAVSGAALTEHRRAGPDQTDPLRLGCYASEIHANLLKEQMSVDPEYLKRQPYVNFKTRAILVDWMVQVHRRFKLEDETLHLAVNVMDRYLEQVSIEKKHLQLLGATSLLIASKYQEIYPPLVRDFLRIAEYTYQKRDLLRMESDVLSVLSFEVTTPSALCFLQYYAELVAAPRQARELASALTELALVESHMLEFKPSVLAEGALCTALEVLHLAEQWTAGDTDKVTLGHCVAQFKLLLQLCPRHPLTAVKEKYTHLVVLTNM